MKNRPAVGLGLFYTRDSEGRSDLAPPQYVEWAKGEAAKLGVAFTGTPEAIRSMIERGVSAERDLYLDYGISGNLLRRPGFDAFRARALADLGVSHLFVPRRDRIARPDNPIDAMALEFELRAAGLTVVLMGQPPLPPLLRGRRIELGDLLTTMLAYDFSGKFRLELAEKLIHAKVRLAREGFSIGGDPPYGFRRWLVASDGTRNRELVEHETVKLPGHHVVWLPTAEKELEVVRRILDEIESVPAARIARRLNADGIPSPKAGRVRTVNGVKVENSGLWTQTTIENIATHPLLIGLMEYGRRGIGDQLRYTPDGPRPLEDGDYRADGKPKVVIDPAENLITTASKSEPVIDARKHVRIKEILEQRGKHLKGKARTRGDSPNPLGGRIYDLNCGWLMYRCARRGRWDYQCGLYQNSQAKCCRHNLVRGRAATQFVMSCLRQRVLAPATLAKLEARLRRMADEEGGEDPVRRQRESDEAELAGIRRKLLTIGRNMALAETEEQRAATGKVFAEFEAEEVRLERRLGDAKPAPTTEPEGEVEAAMGVLDRLGELADAPDADFGAITEVFQRTNAKLFLRFAEVRRGKRSLSVPSGGVLTFGSTAPPAPLYEGPTDRAIIQKMLADGRPVSSVPGQGASGLSETGQEVAGSANV